MCILEVAWQEGIRTSVKEPQIDTQRCKMGKTAGNCHHAGRTAVVIALQVLKPIGTDNPWPVSKGRQGPQIARDTGFLVEMRHAISRERSVLG